VNVYLGPAGGTGGKGEYEREQWLLFTNLIDVEAVVAKMEKMEPLDLLIQMFLLRPIFKTSIHIDLKITT
jgi:hypothetical protein